MITYTELMQLSVEDGRNYIPERWGDEDSGVVDFTEDERICLLRGGIVWDNAPEGGSEGIYFTLAYDVDDGSFEVVRLLNGVSVYLEEGSVYPRRFAAQPDIDVTELPL